MTVVAAALVDADGRVLLQQRAPGRAMAGLWEFPGGKVEEGELPEAALVREIERGTGHRGRRRRRSRPACFASAPVGGRHMILLLYLCRRWRGRAARRSTRARCNWLRPAEMRAAEMPPADAPLIALLEALICRARRHERRASLERLRLPAMAVALLFLFVARGRARHDAARPLSDGFHLLLGGGAARPRGQSGRRLRFRRAPRGRAQARSVGGALPFAYPPCFLILLAPFGLLSYPAAAVAWVL